MLLSTVGTLAAVYMALVAVMYVAQRGLMYHPSQNLETPRLSGVGEMTAIELTTADGLNLVSWYAAPGADRRILVYFHGNGGNIGHRGFKVRPYLDAGFGVFLVGYRGYGGNPGSPTEEGLYHDGQAVLDKLLGDGVEPKNLVLYGESLGCGVAVELAWRMAKSGKPVGGIVLEAPFTSMGDAAQAHYPFLPARLLVKDRYASRSKIAEVDTDVMIFHGDRDRVVPFDLGEALFDAAREPKSFKQLSGAHHNDLYDHGAAEVVLRHLKR